MIIESLPQVVKIKHTTCEFHKKNPGVSYAGCTCMSQYIARNATPEEIKEMEAKKQRECDEK